MNTNDLKLFVTCSRYLVPLLLKELQDLEAQNCKESQGGVYCQGDLALAYRICLWSRLASRVLLPLKSFELDDEDDLYDAVQEIDWDTHMNAGQSLAINCVNRGSPIKNSLYASQKTKDAIVDQFRDRTGERPSVDTHQPDISLHLYLHKNQASLSLDLAGSPLHRRGYRTGSVTAPLKENLAAAMLVRCDWSSIAIKKGALIDPCCGSGTLLIEAAMMAADIAPGLLRDYFGFSNWKQHQADIWSEMLEKAEARKDSGIKKLPRLYGYDSSNKAIHSAKQNIATAGLTGHVHLERCPVESLAGSLPQHQQTGLLISNPPYGERLESNSELPALYAAIGKLMRENLDGWRAGILTGDLELGFQIGIRSEKPINFDNGPIACKLLRFVVAESSKQKPRQLIDGIPLPATISESGQIFANRLKKNSRHLNKWAKREGIHCYRIYDADLPDYSLAIDRYQTDDGLHILVQEYAAPAQIEVNLAKRRLGDALLALMEILDVPAEHIHYRLRKRQKGSAQYEKLEEHSDLFYPIEENGLKFLVNFDNYLDTGLFLDHRSTRAMVRDLAKGQDFLNLFAYTGTATVYALAGGAKTTTTVDLSNTYQTWTQRNLELNGYDCQQVWTHQNQLIRANCLEWIEQAEKQQFGLIFLDPPSFSNSKRMQDDFDIQRDHIELILNTLSLLKDGGCLIFSTNRRGFKLDSVALPGVTIEDISAKTTPEDFRRPHLPHGCWLMTK